MFSGKRDVDVGGHHKGRFVRSGRFAGHRDVCEVLVLAKFGVWVESLGEFWH